MALHCFIRIDNDRYTDKYAVLHTVFLHTVFLHTVFLDAAILLPTIVIHTVDLRRSPHRHSPYGVVPTVLPQAVVLQTSAVAAFSQNRQVFIIESSGSDNI